MSAEFAPSELAPAIETRSVRVFHGHALEVLRRLPDGLIDCAVTSPPYFGLRDYNTNTIWDGGDPACDHIKPHVARSDRPSGDNPIGHGSAYNDAQDDGKFAYKSVCGKCGARRVEPTVWGGEPGCEHAEWGDVPRAQRSGGSNPKIATKGTDNYGIVPAGSSSYCASCGAWRGQLGLEPTPEEYVEHLVEVFRELRRVLAPHGTLWLNLGDSYAAKPGQGGAEDTMWIDRDKTIPRGAGRWGGGARSAPGVKPKDLIGVPWMVAFALRADGWYLRADVIWAKPNAMPESVEDRPTKSHEYVFLLTKRARYYYDGDAIKEPFQSGPSDLKKMAEHKDRIGGKTLTAFDYLYGANATTNIGQKRGVGDIESGGRNARSVWTIATEPYSEAHFATFPRELPRRCILAGCPEEVCTVCGRPRERIVERTPMLIRPSGRAEELAEEQGIHSRIRASKPQNNVSGMLLDQAQSRTVGWTDCGHGAFRKGAVLDPFAGSGTTLAIARDLARSAVGIELSEEYLRLIATRVAQEGLW